MSSDKGHHQRGSSELEAAGLVLKESVRPNDKTAVDQLWFCDALLRAFRAQQEHSSSMVMYLQAQAIVSAGNPFSGLDPSYYKEQAEQQRIKAQELVPLDLPRTFELILNGVSSIDTENATALVGDDRTQALFGFAKALSLENPCILAETALVAARKYASVDASEKLDRHEIPGAVGQKTILETYGMLSRVIRESYHKFDIVAYRGKDDGKCVIDYLIDDYLGCDNDKAKEITANLINELGSRTPRFEEILKANEHSDGIDFSDGKFVSAIDTAPRTRERAEAKFLVEEVKEDGTEIGLRPSVTGREQQGYFKDRLSRRSQFFDQHDRL